MTTSELRKASPADQFAASTYKLAMSHIRRKMHNRSLTASGIQTHTGEGYLCMEIDAGEETFFSRCQIALR